MSTGTLEVHEIANVFPEMSDKDYMQLRADIAKNGQHEPIWLHKGKIIDGRQRYNVCLELGISALVQDWPGRGSLVDFVLSKNLHRRAYTSMQKALIEVELEPFMESEAWQPPAECAAIRTATPDWVFTQISLVSEHTTPSSTECTSYRTMRAKKSRSGFQGILTHA